MMRHTDNKPNMTQQGGFTLLEVILSLGILVTLSVAAASMMKNSINMRAELSQQTKVTHRMRVALDKLTNDLEHAYILNSQRIELNPVERRTNAVFRMRRDGDDSELAFTTFAHEPILANAHESDQTYVVYKLMKDKDAPNGPRNLYRGESKVLPENFDQELPPMKLLAGNIKSFRIQLWNGEDWRNDQWDTSRGDWRNRLPSMVDIQIEAFDQDPAPDEGPKDNAPASAIKTVVYIPRTFGMKEMRQAPNTPRWY